MIDTKPQTAPEASPSSPVRRERILGVRLSQQEIDAIRADAVSHGMAPSEYVRMVMLLPHTIREVVRRIETLTDDVRRDPDLVLPVFEAAKPVSDVWKEVREAEEAIHGAKVLLIRMLQPAKAVVDALERGHHDA